MDPTLESLLEEVKKLYAPRQNPGTVATRSPASKALFQELTGFQVPIKSSYHNSGGFDPTGKGNVGRVHQGIDLRASGGTAIYPIAPGIVTAVRPDPKGGNTVNVKHDNNMTSYYAHMGTIAVHVKDRVDINTVLGTVGASGNAKGFPHLHLQVWRGGQLIDPASVISVPAYTVFNPKTEKLWLPGAQGQAQAWNLQSHIANKRIAFSQADKLLSLAARYYELSIKL